MFSIELNFESILNGMMIIMILTDDGYDDDDDQ